MAMEAATEAVTMEQGLAPCIIQVGLADTHRGPESLDAAATAARNAPRARARAPAVGQMPRENSKRRRETERGRNREVQRDRHIAL